VAQLLLGLWCAGPSDRLPKQGAKIPWRVHQNYALDVLAFRFGSLEDGVMRFSKPQPAADAAFARELAPA